MERPLITHSFTESATLENGPRPGRPFKSIRIVYTAHICGGTLGTLEVGGTTDRAVWMPLSEVLLDNARGEIIHHAVVAFRAMHERRRDHG